MFNCAFYCGLEGVVVLTGSCWVGFQWRLDGVFDGVFIYGVYIGGVFRLVSVRFRWGVSCFFK